jgi:hypothetical protein
VVPLAVEAAVAVVEGTAEGTVAVAPAAVAGDGRGDRTK